MEDLEELKEKYRPIIQKIIDEDAKFYKFNFEIQWEYMQNEDIGLVATCKKNLIITVNINAIIFAYEHNEPLQIESYILHEIRHLYQHLLVNNLKNDPASCPDINRAELWESEFDNYVNIYKDRDLYYNQNIEFDAYTFSYAVMLYKYGKIDYINPPTYYGSEFQFIVNKWLEIFKQQNL